MSLSPHFERHEFACRCGCGFDTVDVELIQLLENIRNHFNRRVDINSACRCLEYNRSIGSRDTSRHTQGKAADITVLGIPPNEVHAYVDSLSDQCGLGSYDTFTHVDVSEKRRRWNG